MLLDSARGPVQRNVPSARGLRLSEASGFQHIVDRVVEGTPVTPWPWRAMLDWRVLRRRGASTNACDGSWWVDQLVNGCLHSGKLAWHWKIHQSSDAFPGFLTITQVIFQPAILETTGGYRMIDGCTRPWWARIFDPPKNRPIYHPGWTVVKHWNPYGIKSLVEYLWYQVPVSIPSINHGSLVLLVIPYDCGLLNQRVSVIDASFSTTEKSTRDHPQPFQTIRNRHYQPFTSWLTIMSHSQKQSHPTIIAYSPIPLWIRHD